MKKCILYTNKTCNDCGECDLCDLDKNKKCNNCGKCLAMEGYDMKAIKIDEILDTEDNDTVEDNYMDDSNFANEKDNSNVIEYEDGESKQIRWELIDDIQELKDLIENHDISNDSESDLFEDFPGLLTYKKEK